MEIIEGNSKNLDLYIEKGNILVDFYAEWCGPCKMLEPELLEIKDKIQIVKINVDNNMDICKKYGVMTVPTLIYFENKDSYNVNVGYINSEDILKFINKF